MSIKRVVICDSPECKEEGTLHDKLERDGLPSQMGWMTVTIGTATWHFCSFQCIGKWSQYKVTARGKHVGTSEHHGTKPFVHKEGEYGSR